jgi:hypothetical protein
VKRISFTRWWHYPLAGAGLGFVLVPFEVVVFALLGWPLDIGVAALEGIVGGAFCGLLWGLIVAVNSQG